MLQQECTKLIDIIISQLKLTSIQNTLSNEDQLRDVFTTLITSLDKGNTRTTIIKNIDEYFVYFATALKHAVDSNTPSSTPTGTFSIKDSLLLGIPTNDLYRALSSQKSVTMRDIYGLLLIDSSCGPTALMDLLCNRLVEVDYHSDYQLLLTIIQIFSHRIEHHPDWKSESPIAIGCFLGLALVTAQDSTITAIVKHTSTCKHSIPLWMTSFSIYWYHKLTGCDIVTQSKLTEHVSAIIQSSPKLSTVNTHEVVETELYRIIHLFVYYSWISPFKNEKELSKALQTLYTSIFFINNEYNMNPLSHLHNLHLLSHSNFKVENIKSFMKFQEWVRSSTNTCLENMSVVLSEALLKEKQGENPHDIESTDTGDVEQDDEDEIDIPYEIDVRRTASVLDTLDASLESDSKEVFHSTEVEDEMPDENTKKSHPKEKGGTRRSTRNKH